MVTSGGDFFWTKWMPSCAFRHTPAHYHPCPECYEPEACLYDCRIEADLGTHKGCPMGDYDPCSRCRALLAPPEEKSA